jgi:hypothetical protein
VYAILGRIVAVTRAGAGTLVVRVAPMCLLPERAPVPRELREVEITVVRMVADPREIGQPGDSLVLSAAESRPWLPPLPVVPLENAWARVEISTSGGGTLLGWRERGRDVEHFARPLDRISHPFDDAGHNDRFRLGWHPSDRLTRLTLFGVQHRDDGMAVMDGVDRRLGLRTAVECGLLDDLPLFAWRRTFRFLPRSRHDDAPRDAIDAIHSLGVGFRAVWPLERDGATGSRVLCSDGQRLISLRCAQVYRDPCNGWTSRGGWMLVEHPLRRHVMLYACPPAPFPALALATGVDTLALEPEWPMHPTRPSQTATLALALATGECCGAAADGAWVGCRTVVPEGLRCAVVGRLPEGEAVFTVDGATQRMPLRDYTLVDVGILRYAVADFPDARPDATLHIEAAGIPQRGAP